MPFEFREFRAFRSEGRKTLYLLQISGSNAKVTNRTRHQVGHGSWTDHGGTVQAAQAFARLRRAAIMDTEQADDRSSKSTAGETLAHPMP